MNKTSYIPILFFLTLFAGTSFFLQTYGSSFLKETTNTLYFALTIIILISFSIKYIVPKNGVPIYVWAILFGISLKTVLLPITDNVTVLYTAIDILAAFILFASGIHVPIRNLKKYFGLIASLSFLGTFLTVILFTLVLTLLVNAFGFEIPTLALIILATILSSIDPSSIRTAVEDLHFKRPFLKDIALSEGALTDVVGVLITRFLLVATLGTVALNSNVSGFFTFFSRETLNAFTLEVTWGVIIGLLGSWILSTWGTTIHKRHWSDVALFFVVPIFCFALGSIFGGSGFLATFLAGLFYEANHKTHDVQEMFDGLTHQLLHPIVFVLLGAVIPLTVFIDTLPFGLLAALLFMLIVRPFVVFLSLLPWMTSKNASLTWREVFFLSFLRETGVIPAVLLLFATVVGILHVPFLFSIGVWIIIFTLTIEPPLTPLLAKRLHITE